MIRNLTLLLLLVAAYTCRAQIAFADSCFSTASTGTSFGNGTGLHNDNSDLMSWTGSAWTGGWSGANSTIAPPLNQVGCRAIFMGSGTAWTTGGEAIGLRIVTPLVTGQTYSFSITYISHGTGSNGSFSPRIYTNNTGAVSSSAPTGFSLGNLPPAGNTWLTSTITFTAAAAQSGHTWITFGTGPTGSSGLISSLCRTCQVQTTAPCTLTANLGRDTALCPGQSLLLSPGTTGTYVWQDGSTGTTFTVTTAGTYTVRVTSGTCVARDTILVTTAPVPTVDLGRDTTICPGRQVALTAGNAGASYVWSTSATSQTITVVTPGEYRATVTNASGCQGSDTIQIANYTIPTTSTATTICAGSAFAFHGQNLTTPGTYRDTLVGQAGCDSIIVLSLTVTPAPTTGISQSICPGTGYSFGGQVRTGAGTYRDTLQTAAGCDSIVILTLTVRLASASVRSLSICAGSTYTFGSRTLSSAGTYRDTVANTVGCDSVITLTLIVNPTPATAISQTICTGSGYAFGGRTLTTAGTYSDTLLSAAGCDSIVILTLSVRTALTTPVSQSVCSGTGYSFGGATLTAPGTYRDTLTSVSGCDSIVILTLTLRPTSTSAQSQSICAGSMYTFGGRTLSAAGTYRDTVANSVGCDSVITLTLTINPAPNTAISQAICNGSTIIFGGQTLTASGTYSDTLVSAAGCDSIVTLTLAITTSLTTPISQTICAGSVYSFGGATLTASGTYSDTVSSVSGCDSIVILTLTVRPSVSSAASQTICAGQSFSFAGLSLSTAGTYRDTLADQYGCDSIVTLTLTVNPTSASSISQNICAGSSFAFDGRILTTAGTYVSTRTNAPGCDSVITLTLTLTPPVASAISRTICAGSSFTFGGQALTTPGTYSDTLTGASGCDSIVTLILSISPPLSSVISASICSGFSYSFGSRSLTAAGTYADTLASTAGCDSIISLTLQVTPPVVAAFSILPASDTISVGHISVTDLSSGADQIGWQVNGQPLILSGDSLVPILAPGSYCVTQTASNSGCADTSRLCVYADENLFVMPNAFTPNGDGINDVFMGSGASVKFYSFQVFNRWGERVFVSSSMYDGWDGTYKGSLQQPGVYIYQVTVVFRNNKTQSYKGSVTLIR